MGRAFDRLNWQHSGEFDQIFLKCQMPRGLRGAWGAWAVLELTGTLWSLLLLETCIAKPLQKVACFRFVNIFTKTRQILFSQNTFCLISGNNISLIDIDAIAAFLNPLSS